MEGKENEGMDVNQRLKLRKHYQKLMDELKESGKDEKRLEENDMEADKLLEQVERPREARYDSELLKMKVNLFRDQILAIPTGMLEFNGEDFTKRFIEQEVEGTSRNAFETLGLVAQNAFCTIPSFSPLYGCFQEYTPQQKKERTIRVKDKVDEVKKPTLVDSSAGIDKEASAIAQHILNILHHAYKEKKSKPIGYFSFVVNPDSFSETVENMFYVSILAREGAVRLFADDDGLPVIAPVPSKEVDALKRDGTYSQSIISINMAEYRRVIKSFKIKKAMITHKSK